MVDKRRSVKKYSTRMPDWRKILRAIDSARMAPSPGNQSFIEYIVVNDPELIEKITEATQQSFVGKAKYIVVVVSNAAKLKSSYADRAEKYATQAVGAAIENFLLAITNQNLVSCWVGLFYEAKIKDLLSISSSLKVEALFPIGIPQKGDSQSVKKTALDNIVYFNEYKNKSMK